MSAPILLVIRLALAIALYAFVGWALYLLWQELRQQASVAAVPRPPALALTRPAPAEPHSFRFTKPEIILGRSAACDCQLDDLTVSTRHARLSFHHNQWWLEDLGSTNGTFLNSHPVTEPIVITSADQLRCGQVLLEISIGD